MFFNNIGNYLWWFAHSRNKDEDELFRLEVADTLFLRTLDDFRIQTKLVEFQINARSPLDKDIGLLKEHLKKVDFLRKVLKIRKRKIKKNIKDLKHIKKLVSKNNFS